MRNRRGPDQDTGVRITVFAGTVLLVPLVALVWVRFVWEESSRPGVTMTELMLRTVLVAAAGLGAYAALRLAVAATALLGRGVGAITRRLDG